MFRHDYSQLLVPTTKELFDAYKVAVGGPFIVPNEARDAAGLGEVDGGDQLYPPSNMTRDESQTQEGQTDDT